MMVDLMALGRGSTDLATGTTDILTCCYPQLFFSPWLLPPSLPPFACGGNCSFPSVAVEKAVAEYSQNQEEWKIVPRCRGGGTETRCQEAVLLSLLLRRQVNSKAPSRRTLRALRPSPRRAVLLSLLRMPALVLPLKC